MTYAPPIYEVDPGQSIQDAIDAAADNGGGEVRLHAGIHQYDIAPKVRPGVHLVGQGQGITLLHPGIDGINALEGSTTEFLNDIRVAHLSVRGRLLESPTEGTNDERGIRIENAVNLRIEDVEVYGCRNMGITTKNADDLLISGCRVYQCSRDGINATGSRAARIVDNYVQGVGDDAIAMHDGNRGAWGTIARNHVEDSHGIKVMAAKDIDIVDNIVRNANGYGIACYSTLTEGDGPTSVFRVKGNTIHGVVADGTVSRGIDLQFGAYTAQYAQIEGNFIGSTGPLSERIQSLIYVSGFSRSFDVRDNTFVNGARGIYHYNNGVSESWHINRNRFERIQNAVVLTPTALASLRMYVSQNIFDMDPLEEYRIAGVWQNTTDGAPLWVPNCRDIFVEGNHFWNYQKTAHGNAATIVSYGKNWKSGLES